MTGNKSKSIEYFHKTFATGLFTGHLPKVPGTWGSLLACLILWLFWPSAWYYQIIIIAIGYPIAVFFADVGIRYYGPDGKPIVIDEILGQMVTLFMAPHNLLAYFIGFILFRIFDIIKLPPARGWERLPGGTGVVADDIAAGVYAAISLQMIIAFSRKLGLELF